MKDTHLHEAAEGQVVYLILVAVLSKITFNALWTADKEYIGFPRGRPLHDGSSAFGYGPNTHFLYSHVADLMSESIKEKGQPGYQLQPEKDLYVLHHRRKISWVSVRDLDISSKLCSCRDRNQIRDDGT